MLGDVQVGDGLRLLRSAVHLGHLAEEGTGRLDSRALAAGVDAGHEVPFGRLHRFDGGRTTGRLGNGVTVGRISVTAGGDVDGVPDEGIPDEGVPDGVEVTVPELPDGVGWYAVAAGLGWDASRSAPLGGSATTGGPGLNTGAGGLPTSGGSRRGGNVVSTPSQMNATRATASSGGNHMGSAET